MKIVGTAIGIVLFLVAGAFLWQAASKNPGPMKKEDFERTTHALASYANETVLFVEQLSARELTAAFARTHRDYLEENVADESRKLVAPLPSDLAAAGAKARTLAARLGAALKDIRGKVADRAALEEIHDEVKRIGAELAGLEGAK
jgi:predicted dinucleotide-binding enzyme